MKRQHRHRKRVYWVGSGHAPVKKRVRLTVPDACWRGLPRARFGRCVACRRPWVVYVVHHLDANGICQDVWACLRCYEGVTTLRALAT